LETTHPSLLARVQDLDDHLAWREFDARYRDLILRYCRRKGLQISDAEDVRQMVMLNLARRLRTFEYRPDRGRFRDYLGRSVANAIHRLYRRPRLERDGLETRVVAEVAVPPDPALDAEWENEWMLHHYRTAMEGVRASADPKSVEVFEFLLAGHSVPDVAQRFEMTPDAVHKVKQRIRDRLKKRIAEQVREDETVV
jgi:RNA polymerase sigma-70 factor (ECF subfamily)